jgi:DNA-binding MarR family transcriptional regulator
MTRTSTSARARNPRSKSRTSRAITPSGHASDARAQLWSRPGFLVRRLLQIHNGLYFEECGKWNVTPVQHGMLAILRSQPEGLDIQSLAAELGVDRSNAADVARRLTGRGLIKQAIAHNDRRMVISRITQPGIDLLDEIAPAMLRSQAKLLAPLDDITRQNLLKAITKLVLIYNDKGRAKLRL